MIPLVCDLAGKRVVIFGGGTVALRKARRFASERDVTVTVHAPTFHTGFTDLACELVRERVDADRARDLLEGAFLAVVATDDSRVNARITAVAREQGCLVNRVDRSPGETDADTGARPDADAGEVSNEDATTSASGGNAIDRTVEASEDGDVIVPSTIQVGEVTVAITTGGRSPAMAKYLRQRLEPVVEDAEPMVRLQRELRAELKGTIEESAKRRERLLAVIESEAVWDALDAGEEQRARRIARECVGLPLE